MGACHIGDGDGIAALRLAPHFVVLITNSRLAHGRFARMAIYDADDRLPEVSFCILDEDSEECQRWPASLDLPTTTLGRAAGTSRYPAQLTRPKDRPQQKRGRRAQPSRDENDVGLD